MDQFTPVAWVKNKRRELKDDFWGDVISEITLDDSFPEEAFDGIERFSHLEIIYHFDRADEAKIVRDARHPRGNKKWPKVGIFAQRNKNRPNRIGLTIVRLLGKEGRTIRVSGLDAVDGTPVIDIKPVVREYLPNGEIKQPEWVGELMKDYWKNGAEH